MIIIFCGCSKSNALDNSNPKIGKGVKAILKTNEINKKYFNRVKKDLKNRKTVPNYLSFNFRKRRILHLVNDNLSLYLG